MATEQNPPETSEQDQARIRRYLANYRAGFKPIVAEGGEQANRTAIAAFLDEYDGLPPHERALYHAHHDAQFTIDELRAELETSPLDELIAAGNDLAENGHSMAGASRWRKALAAVEGRPAPFEVGDYVAHRDADQTYLENRCEVVGFRGGVYTLCSPGPEGVGFETVDANRGDLVEWTGR